PGRSQPSSWDAGIRGARRPDPGPGEPPCPRFSPLAARFGAYADPSGPHPRTALEAAHLPGRCLSTYRTGKSREERLPPRSEPPPKDPAATAPEPERFRRVEP